MERGVTNRSLIEYFLLMQERGQNNNKLIYYDQQGTRIERPIEGGHINEALKLFDGTPKAVGRSSGGLVRAIPYQLVLCEEPYGTVTPQPKIRVRFKEFKRDIKGHIIRGQYQNVAKVVETNQLIDLFSYQLQGPQRFVVDFGRGIVPIYVFAYALDKANRTDALFVELDDVEKAIIQRATFGGDNRSIQAYQVSRDMLRFAGPNNGFGIDEYDVALHNYHHQKQMGLEVIPKTLACAPAFESLTNLTYEAFRKMAIEFIQRTSEGRRLDFLTSSNLDRGEENLVPFGEYEENKGK